MIFRRKDPPCRYRLVQRILNDIQALLQHNPYRDFSDTHCKCFITLIEPNPTYVRIKLLIQPQSGCFNQLVYEPSLYINSLFPMSNIIAYNDRWLYHPNIDLITKKFAIPKEQGELPNSISFTIKYLKLVCYEPCLYNVPYNIYNMEAAIAFKSRRDNEEYGQLMFDTNQQDILSRASALIDEEDNAPQMENTCNLVVFTHNRTPFSLGIETEMFYMAGEIRQLRIKEE